jgi:hypothetical protein
MVLNTLKVEKPTIDSFARNQVQKWACGAYSRDRQGGL